MIPGMGISVGFFTETTSFLWNPGVRHMYNQRPYMYNDINVYRFMLRKKINSISLAPKTNPIKIEHTYIIDCQFTCMSVYIITTPWTGVHCEILKNLLIIIIWYLEFRMCIESTARSIPCPSVRQQIFQWKLVLLQFQSYLSVLKIAPLGIRTVVYKLKVYYLFQINKLYKN